MKHLLYILILTLLSGSDIRAQKTATATMRISATIVSGVTLNHVEAIDLDIYEENSTRSSFEFTTPEHLDSEVETKEKIILVNEFGDQLELATESECQTRNGRHRVNLKASVDSESTQKLKGRYLGNLTTTINYL